MIVKTSTLTRAALNWAVLTALGGHPIMRHTHMREKAKANNYTGDLDWHLSMQRNIPITVTPDGVTELLADYCADWAEGGPIIEQEGPWVRDSAKASPAIAYLIKPDKKWFGYASRRYEGGDFLCYYGETFLIAAMRCYVASKLGAEVDIPEELF